MGDLVFNPSLMTIKEVSKRLGEHPDLTTAQLMALQEKEGEFAVARAGVQRLISVRLRKLEQAALARLRVLQVQRAIPARVDLLASTSEDHTEEPEGGSGLETAPGLVEVMEPIVFEFPKEPLARDHVKEAEVLEGYRGFTDMVFDEKGVIGPGSDVFVTLPDGGEHEGYFIEMCVAARIRLRDQQDTVVVVANDKWYLSSPEKPIDSGR